MQQPKRRRFRSFEVPDSLHRPMLEKLAALNVERAKAGQSAYTVSEYIRDLLARDLGAAAPEPRAA